MTTETEARDLIAGLTAKQIEVLDLLVRHQTTKDIARILSLAPSTVDQRIAAVREKWQTADRKATARRYAQIVAALEAAKAPPAASALEIAHDDAAVNAGAHATPPHRHLGGARRAHHFLDAWDARYGRLGRASLIVFAALALAMVLATSLGVANALGALLKL